MIDPAPGTAESALARRLLSQRRERDDLLGPDLFGEPVWNILLNLFVAHEEGRAITPDELCAQADVPKATAQRWIGTLEREGRITRKADPAGVALTPQVAEQLRDLLRFWSKEEGKERKR